MKAYIKHIIKYIMSIFKEKQFIPITKPVNTNNLLSGKVALITGGNGGIGFAMAEAFIRSGCQVIIAGTNEPSLIECCKRLGEASKYIVLDVIRISEISSKIQSAAALFEKGKIDILVNSAGVIAHSDFFTMEEEEYDKIMNVNSKGTFFMNQQMGKYMIENNIKGHILNVTSSSALRPAWTAYQMSKWAVRGLTLGAADKLLPYGIIVNAIAPGPVATKMLDRSPEDTLYMHDQPSKRFAMPSEIANLAVFMVSDMGNLIVGDTYYITGGSGIITYHH